MKKLYTILLLSFLLSGCSSILNETKNPIVAIQPPLNGIKRIPESVTINPSINQIARFQNGVNIEIPANAFIDKNGEVIEGKVTLSIESYNSVAEIIASGIPMVFHQDGNTLDFESAGMFKFSGKAEGSEVFIKEGKSLKINYPTDASGEGYDFFHFEELEGDLITKGSWKKLSNNTIQEIPKEKILDTFKLKFASKDYPELKELESIEWKLGTSYGNPKATGNKWVLKEEWTSLEISQPKMGFKENLLSTAINNSNGYPDYNAIHVTKDKSRIIVYKNPTIKIFSQEGDLLKTIDLVTARYKPFKILAEKFLIVRKGERDFIYDLDGKQIGIFPKSHGHELNSTNEIVIYQKPGEDRSVFIADITGKLIKKIGLNDESKTPDLAWSGRDIGDFFLSPQNEIITTSNGGVEVYDLKGNRLYHKAFRSFNTQFLKEGTLILNDYNGGLIVWNYKRDIEIKSKDNSFNLREKIIGNEWFYSNFFSLKNTSYLLINQPVNKPSILWDYKTNEVHILPIRVPNKYYEWDHLSENILEGYDTNNNTYQLYDLIQNKVVLKVPNTTYYGGDEIEDMKTYMSEDKQRVLVNKNKNPKYYDLKSGLITDFRKYDSLIYTAGFIDNDLVFTISKDGFYRCWDKKGDLLNSKYVPEFVNTQVYKSNDSIVSWDYKLLIQKFFDYDGNLRLNPGRALNIQIIDKNKIVFANMNGKMLMKSFSEIDSTLYQINVRTKTKEFITYVYLNTSDLRKINKVRKVLINRMLEEGDRKERESKMMRSFQINQFGIYNWDKFLKLGGLITFNAKFDFGVPVAFNDISVFLVIELDGKIVIRYPESRLSSFTMNPKLPNKLIAILPGNKVAVFTQEDFGKVDFDKVVTEKFFQFNMRVVDESVSSLFDLEETIQK